MPIRSILSLLGPVVSLPDGVSSSRLSTLDLALVALYLIGITLFGLRFSRNGAKQAAGSSLERYFLADNTIPWWAIALSIVSAETSTLTIISIPGVAFAGDLGFLQVVLGYMLGRVVVAGLFLPKYFRGEMLTAYQLIDQRFGSALHKLTAGLFLLTRAAAEGVRVFAISIVVSIAIGTGDTLSIGIISALTLLYTFEGGLAAVIWTDVVQMALYVAGTIVAMITLGHHVPGGWSYIHAVAAPLGKFHWLDFGFSITKSYTFWAGILGGTFLTMASHGTDQLMVQRLLAARNLRESRLALLSSGVVIFIQFTLFLLIGVGLFVFYGMHPLAFSSPDRIFPTFIVQEMPHGVAGLLVAAILAAAMSNLSAALNSLASTTVVDFFLPWRSARDKQSVQARSTQSKDPEASRANDTKTSLSTTSISRIATVFWAIVLFAIACYSIQAGGKGHVVETGLSIASVAYGSLLGVFLLGTLTRYATQTGAILGMICGLATNLFLWLSPANSGFTYTTPQATRFIEVPHVAFTWYVLIGALVTFAIGSLFSLLLPKPRRAAAAVFVALMLSSFAAGGGSASAQSPTSQPSAPFIAPSSPAMSGSSSAANRPSQAAAYDFTPVSTAINTAIAQKKLPGAIVVIGHNNHIVFEQAYGNRKLAGEPGLDGKPSPAEPMTEDTIFDMASLTKLLATTTSVLQLYEQHKLDLDAPVAQYLPEFAVNGKDKITVRELMTHYSGLPEDVSLKDDWGLKAPDKAEGIRRAMNSVPYGPPGLTFKYSDINFITLGYLVETISGRRLEDYTRENVFQPLGMVGTAYHPFDRTCGPAVKVGAAVNAGPKPMGRVGITCPPGSWSPYALDPNTAPTAHDDESKAQPALNPDFDQLLRGTVHDPTTRRMGGVAGHAGVFSTAADMAIFAQALLDKLLRDTGPFPLSQATLMLATSPNAPATAVATATIFTQAGDPIHGVASRGLGWDLNSAFSRPRGTIFPITTPGHPGSFGHTGFTGTSLWIDPVSDTYVVLLANAIHPRGGAPISPLRGEVATLAARALGLEPPSTPEPTHHVGTVMNGAHRIEVKQELKRTDNDVLRAPSIPASPGWVGPQNPVGAEPTHHVEAVMNGARRIEVKQELKRTDNDFLRTPCIPASPGWLGPNQVSGEPTHHDETAMNGAHRIEVKQELERTDNDFLRTPSIPASPGWVGPQNPAGAEPTHHVEAVINGAHGIEVKQELKRTDNDFFRAPSIPASPGWVGPNPVGAEPTHHDETVMNGAHRSEGSVSQTQTGIDVLEQTNFAALTALAAQHGNHLRIGLLTNQTGLDSDGHRTIDILAHAGNGIELTTLFTPEHGLYGRQDTEHLAAEQDAATHLPVISLYGAKPADRHPKQSDLRQLDAVLIDLQDAGVRTYTYETITGYFLEACAHAGIPLVVLDRPNPIGGVAVQGPLTDVGHESYSDFMPYPIRHGLTLGELARYFNAFATEVQLKPELIDGRAVTFGVDTHGTTGDTDRPPATRPGLNAALTVIPMQHWSRNLYFDQTGLTFTPPSPNLRTIAAAVLLPALTLVEATNISVGRGTNTPFEAIGASFIDSNALAAYLTARNIPGVRAKATTLVVAEDSNHYPGHGQTIPAVRFEVTDRTLFDSPELGLEIAAALRHLYPKDFQLDRARNLIANTAVLDALKAGTDPREIAAGYAAADAAFRRQSEPFRLYR